MHRYLRVIMTAAILTVLAEKTVGNRDNDESTMDTVDPDTLGKTACKADLRYYALYFYVSNASHFATCIIMCKVVYHMHALRQCKMALSAHCMGRFLFILASMQALLIRIVLLLTLCLFLNLQLHCILHHSLKPPFQMSTLLSSKKMQAKKTVSLIS